MSKKKNPQRAATAAGTHGTEKAPHENNKKYITDRSPCQTERKPICRRKRMEPQSKPGYWAVIPAEVRYDPQLPLQARLLYAEISALTDLNGYCFASNAYLMNLYQITERTLQRNLRALEKRGYIRIENGDGGRGRRRIYAGINPLAPNPDKNDGVPNNPDKNDGVTPTKMTGSIDNNIIYQEPPASPPEGSKRASADHIWRPERFAKFWDYYPKQPDGRKPNKARAVKAWNKLKPDDSTINAMATALKRQMKSDLWQRGIGIPYASTWLNQRMWEEDFSEPAPGAQPREEDRPEWF